MTTEPRFDGCEVVRQLRSGPATDWYLARQSALGRTVVIKSLSPHVLPDSPFAAPLEREAQLLGQLRHRNIVQLYDFKKREQMWLVLEYIHGWTLEELLEKLGRVSVPVALAIARKLLAALEYIHDRGIIHRELSPRNVLISTAGEVKLTNFFFATEQETPPPPELLEGDSGFADPSYMSPEQVLGEPTDRRSDLFSLGVVLYEMVTGRRPFDAPDNRTTSQRIRHDPPAPLGPEVVDATPLFERLLLRALAKLPSDRFSDAREFSVLLDRALASYGELTSREIILHALGQAGLVEITVEKPPAKPVTESYRPLAAAIKVYGASLALLLSGAVAIHWLLGEEARRRPTKMSQLALVPKNAGTFRAVARPWAYVFVDGQQVDTTPFARPVPLSPGTHYVRFEHPSTPPVHRRIEVVPGGEVFLTVEMPLPRQDPEQSLEEALLKPPRGPDGGMSP